MHPWHNLRPFRPSWFWGKRPARTRRRDEKLDRDGAGDMKDRLLILIGGSDEQNGDYSLVHQRAQRGGTTNWSSLKDSRPGDRALIYIQRPHSALIAKADVLAKAVKGKPGDYAYRARIGHFKLLPNKIGIDALRKRFPKWGWLRQPRGKAIVPAQYADDLWKLIHQHVSTVQILISNSGIGQEWLRKMAQSGKSAFWSAPKLTVPGDTVLFYVDAPISAIIAIGKALTSARPTRDKWYEAKVGRVRLLDSPIPLAELRAKFPDWAWLQKARMFAYVNPERASALLERSKLKIKEPKGTRSAPFGGGFGDAKTNALVERAAVRKVRRHLEQRGFEITSRERDFIGYDLDARKGSTEWHVEVKGVSGEKVQFPITRNEVTRAETDSSFRLIVVTEARTKRSRLHTYRGSDIANRFILQPISYMAAEE